MAAQTAPHELITASRVSGTLVFNSVGKKIGHVKDLSIEKASGQVCYAILSFGGFLGFDVKFQALPWAALTYDPAKAGYVVHIAMADLENAPSFTAEELENFGAGHRESVNEYYAQFPYGPV